jgi:SAM-dependent methyltransferase
MPQPLDAVLAEVRNLLLDPALTRAVAAGRRRGSTPSVSRAELRPVALKGGPRLQIVTDDGSRPYTRNVAPGPEAAAAVDALLAEPFGNWHVETAATTVQVRVTKKGDAQVHRAPAARPDATVSDRPAGIEPTSAQPHADAAPAQAGSAENGRTQSADPPSKTGQDRSLPDGLSQDVPMQGGPTQGLATQGGHASAEASQDGQARGRGTRDAHAPGGAAQDGHAPGKAAQDGHAPDRAAQGGSTQGGLPQGGSTQGGLPQGGQAHDRVKQWLLDPGDPLFAVVGGSAAKRRQVDAFLRALAATLPKKLPTALRVVDLGCGNAYLTFAAYRYLADRGVRVQVVGVDVREDQRVRNSAVAEQLGCADAVTFVAGTITDAVVDPAPDLVLALHACDTATDQALARAVRWNAKWVLAAPCCHHDIAAQLRGRTAPPPYGELTRHPILRERFADVLTDSLRSALLRLHGYRVEVVEFVDSAHTPRNLLLRARLTGAVPTVDQRGEYDSLISQWGVAPTLARLLS